MSFYLDHVVSARVSKYDYGICSSTPFDCLNPEHILRRHKTFFDAAGVLKLDGQYSAILRRVELLLWYLTSRN